MGSVKWGVYAFYDYENEPIYVGQTKESIGSRISRHLTNQRTDAVAMNVLDPFEVCYIEVWPLPHLQVLTSKAANAKLNDYEFAVYVKAIRASRFDAVLNEKDPRKPTRGIPALPASIKGRITASVEAQRSHPDVRIARRAQVLGRLAQVISERQVKLGLRRTLLTQARRLAWLADRRFRSLQARGLQIEIEEETKTHEDDSKD